MLDDPTQFPLCILWGVSVFALVDSLSMQRLRFSFVECCTAWIWIWLKQITSNHLFVLCKADVPENEKIICGLLEVPQFEKSYAEADATFRLEAW